MSQNNPASWTNNEWKFSYEIPEQESGLPGQLSPVGDRQQSPLDMLGAFGEALFSGIFDTLGNIFNGVIEIGGAIAGGLIEGVKSLVGWVGSTIASLFSGGEPRIPPPPIYSEIRTDLEGDIKPFVDAFKESQEKAFQAVADAQALRELFDENQQIVSDRIGEAEDKLQQVGDVDAKISAEATRILAEVEIHKAATEEALGKAETVREDLAAYKLAADAKIQSALTDAKAGLDKLDALEPKVSGVISDLEAYELAVDAQIQDLLSKTSGAITDAGQALTQYDDLLGKYEGFKTQASGSLEALRKSSTTQGQKLGVIEDDMPGIKTSITNVFALAETAQSTVDNLQIGGRNLLRNSKLDLRNSNYQVARVDLAAGHGLQDGETVTLSIKGQMGDGKTTLGVHNSQTQYVWQRATAADQGADGVYRVTAPFSANQANSHLFLFAIPNTVTTESSIEWIKLERGDRSTDWTPAPEDVAADIATAQAKADKAEQDAEKKADDARIAAEKYAKEKSEADVALALVAATAEAARVAQEAAAQAVLDSASDADDKVALAETALKAYADAQAAAAQEAAEATAALDATTKANKAKTDAEANAKKLSDAAAAAAAAAQSTANQAKAAADVAVTKTVVEYAVGTSETTAPTTGWSTSTPTRTPGSFVWMRSRITYGSGSTTVTSPALLTGNAGATGAAGKGITTTVISYATSASGTATPTTGWVSTLPTVPQGHFLWTRTVTSYTSGSPTSAYAVTRQGADGTPGGKGIDGKTSFFHTAYATNVTGTTGFSTSDANGKTYVGTYSDFTEADSPDPAKYTWQLVKGADGADGKGVKTSVVTYAASTNGTSAPASGWVSTIPTVAQGSYLWTRTVTTFTDGATTTVTAPSRQGVDGGKGDQGVSVTAVTPHYQLVTKGATAPAKPTAATPSGWSTTEPTFETNRELYRADKVTYSNGAFTWTDVSKVSAYTAAENVQTNLDNLQVGGRNLVRNSARSITSDGYLVGLYEMSVPWEKGATYTVSIKGQFLDEAGNQPGIWAAGTGTKVASLSRNPVTGIYQDTFVVPFSLAEQRPLEMRIYDVRSSSGDTYGSSVEWVKIERGNKATDWTPAPEDVEAEIEASVQTSADALNTYRTSNDKAVSDANDAAAAAAGVAQAKGEVIYQSTAPTGARASTANLWIRTSDNKPHTYNGTKWVEVTDKVAADAADKAATALSTAQAKTTTYYGSTAPTGTKTVGDLWLDSGSDNALKRWSGSAWVVVRDGQLAKAIKAAGDAQSTADGKVRSFAQSTAPTGMTSTDVGDIWLDTDDGNKMYRWSGTSWVTMQDHLAVQAKSVADTATTKAETAQSTVDNLQIGGRNLLRNSKLDLRNSNYQVARVDLAAGHGLQDGETVTLSIKGQMGDGKTTLGVHNSQTQYVWQRATAADQGADGVYRVTAPFSANQANSHLFLFAIPNTVTTESSIEWIKLERGDRSTDWTPAPEDVDKSIADVDYKASETGKLIPGMQDSLNIAHSKAETAQSTVDNLEIGGRNLLYKSSEWKFASSDNSTTTNRAELGKIKVLLDTSSWNSYWWITGLVDEDSFFDGKSTYTVSVELRVTSPGGGEMEMSFDVRNSAGTVRRIVKTDKISDTQGKWEKATITIVLPDSGEVRALFALRGSGTSPGDLIEYRNAKIERGRKATDWTPAPEDTEAEIQAQANALAGYQLSNDTAVDDAKKAAQAAAGLAGEKGEVIYSTTTPPVAKRKAANLWIKGPANTPHVWNGSTWAEITDQAAKDAAKAAADANTLAKTKTTTYYQTSAPAASVSVAGDLWIDQSTAGKNTLKRWSGSAWVAVQDKAIAEAVAAAGTAQSTADGKVRSFAQSTAPTGMTATDVGDIWLDTDDGNKMYRWSGSAWVSLQDAAIAAAKKAADDAAESQRIKDTRSVNEPPSYYWESYSRATVREFKSSSVLGTTGGYGVMTTVVPWLDSSGGAITQEFNVNNSDTVLHRRSTGSGETATWTAWKDRAKDLADSITTVGNDLATKTGPNSTLQKNINSLEESTGQQYEDLNTQLWGDQGELNKLNSLLWDDQGKLNQATEIFKSNITGWKKDVYEAFVDFDKTNKHQDGLVAANNRAIKATTEAVSAHQRILQVAYPDSGSAIPMVPGGVNVGTEAAPVYEAMPEWLHPFGVTKVAGTTGMDDKRAAHSIIRKTVTVANPTKVKVNATALYRYSFWIQASAAGSEAFIRLYDQNGVGAVLENTPDAGVPAPRTSGNHMFWFNGNVPTSWTKISGTIRLKPDVTHVYIDSISLNYAGTVTSQWLADIQLSAIIPSQSDVNKALSDVNAAQTAILSSQQDVLDMAFPNTNLVPMTNGIPEWTSTVSTNPIRTPEGSWRFTSASIIQPGTGGKHVPTVNGVVYRAMVRLRRTGLAGAFSIRLRGAGSTTSITNLTLVTDRPAPAGASRTNFLTANPSVGTDWETWYYDFTLPSNISSVRIGYVIGSIGVEVSQLSVVALLPSQMEVDAVQDEAAESNRKAIDALERTVRLSFPHINTLPYSGGNPIWQSRASWITRTTVAANLPPMGQRTEAFSSLINGDGTMVRDAASSVAIPDDVSELRVRGLMGSNGGFFPVVDLHDDAGDSIISAWRRTFPTDDEVSLSGKSEVWYSGSSAGGYPVDGNNTDPWQPFDIVVQVKSGSKNFHIKLSSTSLIAIHGLAVFSYYPSQSEVDFAQDLAMRVLSDSVDLAASIGTAAATAAENLGIAQTAMQMSLVTTASYIPRVMIVKDLGNRSGHERSEHVQVRKDGASTFLIDARGVSWTGLIVATAFYGTTLVTHTFEITPGGGRTHDVPKRVGAEEAKHIRIDYWVNPEVETKPVTLGGTDVPHNRWTELAGTSFTATGFVPEKGPALPVLHIAELDVGWDRATHHAMYGAQIKLDGVVVAKEERSKVGPRYPWGEPYAKMGVTWSGQVMPGQKITFEVFANDTVPSQRRLRDAKRLVSYSKGV